MSSLGRYVLLLVFFIVLIITIFLGLQLFNFTPRNNSNILSQIPDINVNIPKIGSVNIYTNPNDFNRIASDKIRTTTIAYEYHAPEGSLVNGRQVIYGSFVKYDKNLLSVNPKNAGFNYQFNIDAESEISCWPKFFTTSDGKQVDLSNTWLDTSNSSGALYMEGELHKKWNQVYTNLVGGESMIVVINSLYDYNNKNIPSQVILIGCK